MATRAAIASKDRALKADLEDKRRNLDEKIAKKNREVEYYKAKGQNLKNAASATKDLIQAAGGLSAFMNDPKWYTKYGLTEQASRLPTFQRIGTLPFYGFRTSDTEVNGCNVVPGVAVIWFLPSLPNQLKLNSANNGYYKESPINISLTRFMAGLRQLNSRIGDYDAYDFGLYWYSVAGYLLKINSVIRALEAYNTYQASNAYMCETLIKAMGFHYTDFVQHVAEYRLLVQKHIQLFNSSIVIPKELDFVSRYNWLSKVVVRDHDSDKAQMYIFRSINKLDLADDETSINFTDDYGWDIFYYNVIANDMNSTADKLLNSTGIVTMTADLRAAFKDSKQLYQLPDFTGVETLEFSSSIHDLEQIHNMRTLPINAEDLQDPLSPLSIHSRDIVVTNTGHLYQGHFVSDANHYPVCFKPRTAFAAPDSAILALGTPDMDFLNFYDMSPKGGDEIIEATRLRVQLSTLSIEVSGDKYYCCQFNGTEIPLFISNVTIDPTDLTRRMFITHVSTTIVFDPATFVTGTCLDVVANSGTFDWYPPIKWVDEDDSFNYKTSGEIDEYFPLQKNNLEWLHEGAALSLFYIPMTDFIRR